MSRKTRATQFRLALVAAVAALSAAPAPSHAASQAAYTGTFALSGAQPKATAQLVVTSTSPLTARLDLSEKTADGQPIRDYDVELTRRLHLILVSSGLSSFQHLHPSLGSDGHFRIDIALPAPGRYLVYADAVPHGLGQQVFRFAVPFGHELPKPPRPSASSARVHTGPYQVALDTLQLALGRTTMLTVHISAGGKPARDLHPYLGGAAHAIFVAASDLSYLHVHPRQGENMSAMSATSGMNSMPGMGKTKGLSDDASVEPTMTLQVAAPKAGTYKLWLEFRGGGALYVAPFVLTAR